MLRVLVSSAKDLPNVETFGKSDPYTIVIFQGKNYRIHYKSKTKCLIQALKNIRKCHVEGFDCRSKEENWSYQRRVKPGLEPGK